MLLPPPMNPLFSAALRLIPTLSRGTPVVYLLRLQSGVLYIGSTLDLEQRLDDHASGRAGRTTALDPPVALLRLEPCATFTQARQRETQLKHWTRAKKEALISGDLHTLSSLSQSRDQLKSASIHHNKYSVFATTEQTKPNDRSNSP